MEYKFLITCIKIKSTHSLIAGSRGKDYAARGKEGREWRLTRMTLESCTLTSWGHCSKMPPTEQLKITEIYSLAILEARIMKSKCQQGWLFLKYLEKNLSHTFCYGLTCVCSQKLVKYWPLGTMNVTLFGNRTFADDQDKWISVG